MQDKGEGPVRRGTEGLKSNTGKYDGRMTPTRTGGWGPNPLG